MTHKKRKMISVTALMAFGAAPALTIPGGCAVAGPLVVPGADEVARQPLIHRGSAPVAPAAPAASTSGFVTGSASSASTALADPAAPSPVDGTAPAPQPEQQAAVKFTEAQLKEMVGPIALYPDPLLAQVFAASTFPLDIVRAARFVKTNANDPQLKEKIAAEGWDPSVQALAHYPNVLAMMDENLDWTQNLGVAFVNQQSEVLAAVQFCRAQAQSAGNLATNDKQKVVAEDKVIQIVPADPQVIYVPVYEPQVVYVERPYYVESVISFGIGYGVGSWLDLDCDWRARRVCYGGWYSSHHHHKNDHHHKDNDRDGRKGDDRDGRDGRGNWNNGRDSNGTTVRRDDQRDGRNDSRDPRNDASRYDGRTAGNREGEAWRRDNSRAPQVRPSTASAVAAIVRRNDGDDRSLRVAPRADAPATGSVRDVAGVSRSLPAITGNNGNTGGNAVSNPARSAVNPGSGARFDPDARRSDRDRNSDGDVLQPRVRPAPQPADSPGPTPAAAPVARSTERPTRAPEPVALPGPVRSSEIRSTVEPRREAPALRPAAPAPRTITSGIDDRPAPDFDRSAFRPAPTPSPRVAPAPAVAAPVVKTPAPVMKAPAPVMKTSPAPAPVRASAPAVRTPTKAESRASEARERAATARETQRRRG